MKTVIIVGGGIGSLATAIRLLKNGYKVKIIEKENEVGGKINSFSKAGYKFDLTCSILMTPYIYKELFTYANLNYEDYIKFHKLDTTYRVFYRDNTRYDFYSDIEKTKESIAKISRKSVEPYERFIKDSMKKYKITEEVFLKRNMDSLKNLLSLKSIEAAIKLAPINTTEETIRNYIDNEKIINYLLFQSMYVGVSPYNSSNIYTLVPAITQEYGLWHLEGGMYSYIEALERVIKELGGQILTNTEVKEILIEKNKVKGVRTRNRVFESDIVVCNADFPYAVSNLIRNDKHKDGYDSQKIKKMKYSCGVFILYLGTNKKYKDLKVHNIYIGDEFSYNIEAPFRGKMPSNPPMYIYCPTRVNKALAENEGETINIMIRVPNLIEGKITWNGELIKKFKNKIINRLKEIEGLEDIDEHIITEEVFTPNNMEEVFNSYGGAAFGLSHTLSQTTYLRPHIKSKSIDNLYFVGASIHPGVGASIVLLGAEVVANTILKEDKSKIEKNSKLTKSF